LLRLILLVSWLIWPKPRRTASRHIMPRRNGRPPQDPRVLSHRGIVLFPMHGSERRSGMPHLADWFSARLNSKENIDLQCLRNSRNSLAQGQMFNSFSRVAALIAVSTAGVRTTLSRIVLDPGSLFKSRVLIKTTKARARSE
jgi:hypothetical protein